MISKELIPTAFFALILQLKYTKQGKDNLPNYGVVMDTPVYVTAVQSGHNASEVSHSLSLLRFIPYFLFSVICMKRLDDCNSLLLQVKYKEQYHKTKDKYTTILKTADHDRIQNLKHLFSNVSIFLFNAILELV